MRSSFTVQVLGDILVSRKSQSSFKCKSAVWLRWAAGIHCLTEILESINANNGSVLAELRPFVWALIFENIYGDCRDLIGIRMGIGGPVFLFCV